MVVRDNSEQGSGGSLAPLFVPSDVSLPKTGTADSCVAHYAHLTFKKFRFSKKLEKHDDSRSAAVSTDATPINRGTSILSTRIPASNRHSSSPTASPTSQGLHVLHSPELFAIDIIFVHGLGGHSHRTWTKNQDPALFWPKSWLPFEPGMGAARILTFGYNASWRGASKNISTISDFAKELLFEMAFATNEAGQDLDIGSRPILFVGHSMGGLVVKKAYLLGLHDEAYKYIIASVSAVIFLSTPHRGTNLAETLNRVLAATFQSSKSFISDLNKGSHALEELNEQFRHLAPSLSIWSFYETMATVIGLKKIMVLEKDSSILGYPSEISRPLQADHQSMCKYTSPSDANYISVRNAIKSLISSTEKQSEEKASVEEKLDLTELFRNCTTSEIDFIALRRCWIPDTCGWFLKGSEFNSWITASSTSSVLWYNAPPGSGKSVLAAFIINYLRESNLQCQYFFFKHSDQRKSSSASSLKALALQIAKDVPEFRKKLSRLPAEAIGLDSEDPIMIWKNFFEKILSESDIQRPVYWVIDALDECASPKELLDCLKNLVSITVPVRVLVISRRTDSISVAFDRLSRSIPVQRLEAVGQSHNQGDIDILIDQEMHHMRGSHEFREELKQHIRSRSAGNFLWTKLVLDEMMDCHTEESIQEVLDEIPDNIFELYRRMEQNMVRSTRKSNVPLIRCLLEWTACSQWSLNLLEMSQAMKDDFPRILDLSRTIKDSCGQFIQIDQCGGIGLLHHTAREYFMRTNDSQFFIDEKKTHGKLFQRAILALGDTSLKLELIQKQHTLRSTQPFVFYAAANWPYHLGRSTSDHSSTLDSLVAFFQGPAVLSWIHVLSLLPRIDVLVKAAKVVTSVTNDTRKRDASKNSMIYRLSDLQLLDEWAADMTKLVGKFGRTLVSAPEIIYHIVPALSPGQTAIARQRQDSNLASIQVLGLEHTNWTDNLGRIALPPDTQAWEIANAGKTLAVLGSTGVVYLWDAASLMGIGSIDNQEPVTAMALDSNGSRLATYGLKTTKVWMITSGTTVLSIDNPPHTRAMNIVFADNNRRLLVGGDDKVVRYAICDEPERGWRILHNHLLTATAIEGEFANSPMCLAFSDDRVYVAVSYRGAPLSVWRLSDGRCINRCKRPKAFNKGDRRPSTNWFAVDRFTWNPVTGHILGIYKDGCVFKWHPLTDEAIEAPKAADEIAASPNGKLFATSSSDGSVRVWNFSHFSVIYQLSSEDLVVGLAFSLDSRRFYDLRGSVVNIWEPDSVTRFNDNEAQLSDSNSESRPSTELTKLSEKRITAFEAVTALAVSPDGSSYCAGYEDGGVFVFSGNEPTAVELARFYNFLNVTHIIWSPDGRFIACADLAGDIQIKSVVFLADNTTEVKSLPDPQVDLKSSNIEELLFNSDGSLLLISTDKEAFVYAVQDGTLQASADLDFTGTRKWLQHPMNSHQILACGALSAQVFNWETLEAKRDVKFEAPSSQTAAEIDHRPDEPKACPNAISQKKPVEDSRRSEILRVTSAKLCQDSRHLLLTTCSGSSSRTGDIDLWISQLDNWRSEASNSTNLLDAIPSEVSDQVYVALGVLPGSRLVFLDFDLWLCVYDLTGSTGPIAEPYHRYYFIPRDWVGSYSLDSCVLTAEGTLFWARDDRVVRIKCNFEFARPATVL
ncbi:WD40 repeat-containing protein [Sarocladium strictum]